jgi:hypothetical protein
VAGFSLIVVVLPRFFCARVYPQPKPKSKPLSALHQAPLYTLLTYAMRTWALAITFRPHQVALIARSTNPPADGPRRTSLADCPSVVNMLVMFVFLAPGLQALANITMLLKLREDVLGKGVARRAAM